MREFVERYGLKDMVATLAAVCYEQATEVRQTLGASRARDWVRAANYLMGASINISITNTQ